MPSREAGQTAISLLLFFKSTLIACETSGAESYDDACKNWRYCVERILSTIHTLACFSLAI